MESGNSSSMQSSSGGGGVGRAGAGIGGDGGGGGDDQEYDSSVGNSSNYFFNTSTTTPPPPPPSQLQQQYNSSMQQHFLFSNHPPPPSSQLNHNNNNFLDTFGDQSNFQNIMFWQQPQQQQLQHQQQQQQQQQQHTTNTTTTTTATTTNHPLPPSTSSGKGTGTSGSGQKNPRKRTRASRRAPTTVLTTDTTNFRAMVQEFTGIPSSPFSAAASPFLSRRLTDLFTGSAPAGPLRPAGLAAAAARSSSGGSHLERLLAGYSNTGSNPNFPFRPSAHKPLINTSNLGITPPTHDQHTNLPFQSLLQTGAISSTPSSLLLPSGSTNNSNNNATLRYNSPGGLLSGGSGLPGAHFQELSGILGNHHQMFLSSTDTNPNLPGGGSENVNINAFSLPSHMGGTGTGGGEEGGWRTGPSNDEINNVGNDGNNNNDSSNQQMERTISGSGTTNYDHRNHNRNRNHNHNVSNSNANAGSSTGAQGTLGNFLD